MQTKLATFVAVDEPNETSTEIFGRASDATDDLAEFRSQVDSQSAQQRILASNPMDLS
jgi:hypothetical protein